jgi:nucleotide-binding universal stress UspA family protein
MYNCILAPLDGSKLSECILNHVKTIAKGCRVQQVILLRVVEPTIRISESSEEQYQAARESTLESAREYLGRVAEQLQQEGINTVVEVIEGAPSEKILEYLKIHSVDLIIMGTHGRTGVARLVMGSVAEKVARQSGVPVLLAVPAGFRE